MQCLVKINFRISFINHNILLPTYFKFNKMINACVHKKSGYLYKELSGDL